jgi:hypothetical protein
MLHDALNVVANNWTALLGVLVAAVIAPFIVHTLTKLREQRKQRQELADTLEAVWAPVEYITSHYITACEMFSSDIIQLEYWFLRIRQTDISNLPSKIDKAPLLSSVERIHLGELIALLKQTIDNTPQLPLDQTFDNLLLFSHAVQTFSQTIETLSSKSTLLQCQFNTLHSIDRKRPKRIERRYTEAIINDFRASAKAAANEIGRKSNELRETINNLNNKMKPK